MKIYKTQAEVKKDIKNGVLAIEGDVSFECSISINASIKATGNLTAQDLTAHDIDTHNITAHDIDTHNITAHDIDARNINALDIAANNIAANNIQAWSINANDISYYALCIAYKDIICSSITATREVHSEPVCLGGELIIKAKPTETIKIGNNTYNKNDVETALRDVKTL